MSGVVELPNEPTEVGTEIELHTDGWSEGMTFVRENVERALNGQHRCWRLTRHGRTLSNVAVMGKRVSFRTWHEVWVEALTGFTDRVRDRGTRTVITDTATEADELEKLLDGPEDNCHIVWPEQSLRGKLGLPFFAVCGQELTDKDRRVQYVGDWTLCKKCEAIHVSLGGKL